MYWMYERKIRAICKGVKNSPDKAMCISQDLSKNKTVITSLPQFTILCAEADKLKTILTQNLEISTQIHRNRKTGMV